MKNKKKYFNKVLQNVNKHENFLLKVVHRMFISTDLHSDFRNVPSSTAAVVPYDSSKSVYYAKCHPLERLLDGDYRPS